MAIVGADDLLCVVYLGDCYQPAQLIARAAPKKTYAWVWPVEAWLDPCATFKTYRFQPLFNNCFQTTLRNYQICQIYKKTTHRCVISFILQNDTYKGTPCSFENSTKTQTV